MEKRCRISTIRVLCSENKHTLVYSLISRGVLANKLEAAQSSQTLRPMFLACAALTVFAQKVVRV